MLTGLGPDNTATKDNVNTTLTSLRTVRHQAES